jgi:hypothetical protein
MTENRPDGSTPEEEPALSRQEERDTSQLAEDPGYLTETGEAVGKDALVAPIIGGPPPPSVRPGISAPRWTSGVRTRPTSRPPVRTRIDHGPPPGFSSGEDPRTRTAPLSRSRQWRPNRSGRLVRDPVVDS